MVMPAKPAPTPVMSTWVIFDNPSDFPGKIVVRRQTVMSNGEIWADNEASFPPTLEHARQMMRNKGLNCIPRHPTDDPVIVESWV